MVQRELIQTGQVDIDPPDAHLHVGKASFHREALQFPCGRNLPRGAKADGGGVACESSERVTDGAVVKPGVDPDAERETAATVEHAAHLPHCDCFIRKEL